MKSYFKILSLMLIVSLFIIQGCDDDNGSGPVNNEGLYAAVTSNEGLTFLDLEDFANPVELSNISLDSYNDVIVSGDVAFLSSPNNVRQVITMDISDLSNPQVRGTAGPGEGDGRGLLLIDNQLYLCAMGLHLLDVSNIDQLSVITSYDMDIGGGRDIKIRDGYIYIPNGDRGLDVIGFEEDHFYERGGYNDVNMFCYQMAFVDDSHFLMSGYLAGLKYMNTSNPDYPDCISTISLDDGELGVFPEGVIVLGDYAYVTSNVFDYDNNEYTHMELDVIKINEGTNMELIRRLRFDTDTVDPTSIIYEHEGILAVTRGNHGILFFDTEDPENPSEIGFYEVDNAQTVEFFTR